MREQRVTPGAAPRGTDPVAPAVRGPADRWLTRLVAGLAIALLVLAPQLAAEAGGAGAAAARVEATMAAAWAPAAGTAGWAGLARGHDHDPGADAPVDRTPPDAFERALGQPDPPLPPRRMARFGELVLRVPTRDPVLIGYHEAATDNGLELTPIGTLIVDRNRSDHPPPEDDPAGAPYLIMASRGRSTGATTAIDIAMVDDDPVLAPVSGVVTDVRSTLLYGEYPDQRVEIAPHDDPGLKVVIVHVSEVVVGVGDRVRAGRSVIAGTATRFPFLSQIDNDTLPEVWPHVHIEVQRADARRPGDPWPDQDAGDG